MTSKNRNFVYAVLFIVGGFIFGTIIWAKMYPSNYNGWVRESGLPLPIAWEPTAEILPTPAPQTSYKVMVTVNDVRVYSQRIEGEEVEFLFILNFSYYDVAVCHGGDRCVNQVDTALNGYWPETLDYLGSFLYKDERWDKVNVVVKSWWSDSWSDGECIRTDTELVEYRCTPGALLKYTIDYDASRHTKEEGGKIVSYINRPYLSVKLAP